MRQLGNAVRVKLAAIISSSVKAHLLKTNISTAGVACMINGYLEFEFDLPNALLINLIQAFDGMG